MYMLLVPTYIRGRNYSVLFSKCRDPLEDILGLFEHYNGVDLVMSLFYVELYGSAINHYL